MSLKFQIYIDIKAGTFWSFDIRILNIVSRFEICISDLKGLQIPLILGNWDHFEAAVFGLGLAILGLSY
jgi:hypothetical protein